MPTWMNSAPISAAANASAWNVPSVAASAVPTSTGATAAGSVRGRAAISQMRAALGRSATRHGRCGNCEKSGRRLAL